MVPSERTATAAIGHGKQAARNIDAWLRNEEWQPPESHELATFDKINPWYYPDAPKVVQTTLEVVRRQCTFEEVSGRTR